MKRIHIGLAVDDLEAAVDFYTRLFGIPPTLRRPDYAKWMLDDPFLNFSLDARGEGPPGTAHYGIQVESETDLAEARRAVDEAGLLRRDQDDLVCGYQRQDKSWVADPHGLAWEVFHTHGLAGDDYGCGEMPDLG
jgi:catechol 2,3-dioxygenase-like lactoylglutathione lyase family enzyme